MRLAARKIGAFHPGTCLFLGRVTCPLTNDLHGSVHSTGRHQLYPCLAEFSPDSLGGNTSMFLTLVSSYLMAQMGKERLCWGQPGTDNPTTGAGSRDPTDKRAFWTGKVWASHIVISILLRLPTHCALKHLIFLLLN